MGLFPHGQNGGRRASEAANPTRDPLEEEEEGSNREGTTGSGPTTQEEEEGHQEEGYFQARRAVHQGVQAKGA